MDEHGAVAIVFALTLTVLMGMAALAVDVGVMLAAERELQNGTDAAAIAIARQCAQHAVDPVTYPTTCSASNADATASTYVSGNATATAPYLLPPDLSVSWSGKVGGITVRAETTEQPIFASMLGVTGPLNVGATATARWGPLAAVDAVFPLVVCKGALPEPNVGPVTLMVDPAASTSLDACDGAPDEPPFGWSTPDDPDLCTAKITLLPSIYLDVLPSDEEPASAGCDLAIDELHNDIDATAVCHATHEPYHCHSSATADDRTRVLAVYDPTAGGPASRPSHALLAFEFTGARLGDRASHSGDGNWSGPCDPDDPTYAIDELQCIEGVVRDYIPPTDGPLMDPSLTDPSTIEDTTVLDVRLVD